MENATGSPKKKWFMRPAVIWTFVILILFVVVMVSGLFLNGNNSSTSPSIDTPNQQENSQTTPFATTTITDLINNPQSGSLVQVTGVIAQKGEFTYSNNTSYYLKITNGIDSTLVQLSDGSGTTPPKYALNQFVDGETISVQAGEGELGSCSDTEDGDVIGKMCTLFGVWNQKSVPVLIPINITVVQKNPTSVTNDSVSSATKQ